MCLAVPGQIVETVDHALARVEVGGIRRVISTGLLSPDEATPGHWVLVHVGFALCVIDEAEAQRTILALNELGSLYEQELDQLRSMGAP